MDRSIFDNIKELLGYGAIITMWAAELMLLSAGIACLLLFIAGMVYAVTLAGESIPFFILILGADLICLSFALAIVMVMLYLLKQIKRMTEKVRVENEV